MIKTECSAIKLHWAETASLTTLTLLKYIRVNGIVIFQHWEKKYVITLTVRVDLPQFTQSRLTTAVKFCSTISSRMNETTL